MNKNSLLNFDYQQHNFKFEKRIKEKAYKLIIDNFPFEQFLNDKKKEKNDLSQTFNQKIKSYSVNNNVNFANIINKISEKQKRTGSDIYKSDQIQIDIENNIKSHRIKYENYNVKDNDKKVISSRSYNFPFKNDKNKSLEESKYINVIEEGEIPEYDDIHEKIINFCF